MTIETLSKTLEPIRGLLMEADESWRLGVDTGLSSVETIALLNRLQGTAGKPAPSWGDEELSMDQLAGMMIGAQ